MARAAMRLIVEGRVQGVGFRWWTRQQGRALNLDGWARNRRDGSVEILAMGNPATLDRLAAACAYGPEAALVDKLTRTVAEDDGSTGFRQAPTV